MIRYATSETLPELFRFCRGPFGCKIASLAGAYGTDASFAGFWLQNNGVKITAALSRLDDAAVLFVPGEADWEELAAFVDMLGVSTLQCDAKTPALPGWREKSGPILRLTAPLVGQKEGEPNLREIHDLLRACESSDFVPPKFEAFYVDYSHRIRHRAARVCASWAGETLAACALTTAETKAIALLGAVACRPELRRQGFAGRAVSALCEELWKENKEIYLFRSETENRAFYESLGFLPCGRWREWER